VRHANTIVVSSSVVQWTIQRIYRASRFDLVSKLPSRLRASRVPTAHDLTRASTGLYSCGVCGSNPAIHAVSAGVVGLVVDAVCKTSSTVEAMMAMYPSLQLWQLAVVHSPHVQHTYCLFWYAVLVCSHGSVRPRCLIGSCDGSLPFRGEFSWPTNESIHCYIQDLHSRHCHEKHLYSGVCMYI
jgi:hypothetical protein